MSVVGPLRSGIYAGHVSHRRYGVPEYRFRQALTMPLLFLDELDEVVDRHPLWSAHRPSPVWFRRADYLGDRDQPLDLAVRDVVHERLGRRPGGPVAVLTQPRTWGWLFNPITVYFCFAGDGLALDAVVAEVTNTPWHERHVYVVEGAPGVHRFPKAMHVSPFLGMDHDYVMSWSIPGDRVTLRLGNRPAQDGNDGRPGHDDDRRLFDAALVLERREPTRREMSRLVWRRPLQTYGVSTGIYRHALALVAKGAPFHHHPQDAPTRLPRVRRDMMVGGVGCPRPGSGR